MWSKLKELVNSKKTILMVLTIVGALVSALVDIITARECLSIICGVVGINMTAIGFQDFGKEAQVKVTEREVPVKDVKKVVVEKEVPKPE